MTRNTSPNLRRNQIVAERTMEKVRREHDWASQSDEALWRLIEECIADSIHTRKYLGHIHRGAAAALAEGAARELKARGTQLQLPV